MTASFADSGAAYFSAALSSEELHQFDLLVNELPSHSPGQRLVNNSLLDKLVAEGGALDNIARNSIGALARPVRAVLFNKNTENNWGLPWHQDRTIVVREKSEVPGFGPWSRKAGLIHVEPPFDVISKMVMLRAHLDACDKDNAPLKYVPGSHRLGRIPTNEIEAVVEQLGSDVSLANVGDVWLYATGIVHASEPATQPHRRYVLQVDYSCDDLPEPLKWLGT